MNPYALVILLALAGGAFGQEPAKRIGAIEFFGASGVDLAKIRAAMPFHEKDPFDGEAASSRP